MRQATRYFPSSAMMQSTTVPTSRTISKESSETGASGVGPGQIKSSTFRFGLTLSSGSHRIATVPHEGSLWVKGGCGRQADGTAGRSPSSRNTRRVLALTLRVRLGIAPLSATRPRYLDQSGEASSKPAIYRWRTNRGMLSRTQGIAVAERKYRARPIGAGQQNKRQFPIRYLEQQQRKCVEPCFTLKRNRSWGPNCPSQCDRE